MCNTSKSKTVKKEDIPLQMFSNAPKSNVSMPTYKSTERKTLLYAR